MSGVFGLLRILAKTEVKTADVVVVHSVVIQLFQHRKLLNLTVHNLPKASQEIMQRPIFKSKKDKKYKPPEISCHNS